MGTVDLIFLGIGLSMDAFAAALCRGVEMKKIKWGRCFLVAAFFGGFQALMPLVGWLLGTAFQKAISDIDHWIAFALLVLIGGKMIFDALRESDREKKEDRFSLISVLLAAVATSIDALAVGVSFALIKVDIWLSIAVIGIITFLLSIAGVFIGSRFGNRFENKAEIAGGVILILIGVKILLEHLGVLTL